MATPAAISQSVQVLTLLIKAINKFREQVLDDLELAQACADFEAMLEQKGETLASLDRARPVVPQSKWLLIEALKSSVEAAKEELTNEKDGLLHFDIHATHGRSRTRLQNQGIKCSICADHTSQAYDSMPRLPKSQALLSQDVWSGYLEESSKASWTFVYIFQKI